MGELRIPVGVAVTLLGLAVSLQAVTRRIEQFPHQGAAHLVALLLQRFGQSSHAFAGPPQRRFRIPPRRRFDQRLEIRDQCRVFDNRWLASRPRPPNPLRWFVLRQFLQTPPDRARRHSGCRRHRGNATITGSKRLRRRDQTTAAFVEKRCYCEKPLPDGFNIDHHHNIWYDHKVVNPYFTLSKADSVISGQALSKEAFDRIEPRGRGRGVMEDKAGVPVEPGANPGVLVGGVVVEDDVDDLPGRDVGFDRIEKADELLMAMVLHAAADDLALQDVERGKQGRGAMPLVIMRHCRAAALLHRQTGLGAVERLVLRFFVDRQHHRMRRRIDIKTDNVAQLGDELAVARQLELTHAMRLQPMGVQIRCTELTLIPTCLAITWAVQWVTSPGGSVCVSATVRSCTVAASRGIRDGRVLSRSSPSTPCAMKRSCQRHTVTLLLPVWRMIVVVPTPSAVISTMRARHTCFCGVLRSATIAAKRTRSPSLTSTVIPWRMLTPQSLSRNPEPRALTGASNLKCSGSSPAMTFPASC